MYELDFSTVETNLTNTLGGGLAQEILNILNSNQSTQTDTLQITQYVPNIEIPSDTDLLIIESQFSSQLTTIPTGPSAIIIGGSTGVTVTLPNTNDQFVQFGSGRDVVSVGNGLASDFVDLGAGDDQFTGANVRDQVIAGTGTNALNLRGGDDSVDLSNGSNSVDGGTGFDSAYIGGKSTDYDVKVVNGAVVVTNKLTGDINTIFNTEYVKFGDGHVVINVQTAEQAAIARIYEVVLNREADAAGIKFWSTNFAPTKDGVVELATKMLASDEFTNDHGAASSLSNLDFLKALYHNAFERDIDAGGQQFWLDQLSGGMTRGEVAVRFAFENEAQQKFEGMVNVIKTMSNPS